MHLGTKITLLTLVLFFSGNTQNPGAATVDEARLNLRLKTLERMAPETVRSSPQLKKVAHETAEELEEDLRLIDLVIHLELEGFESQLLSLAAKSSDTEQPLAAIEYVLSSNPKALESGSYSDNERILSLASMSTLEPSFNLVRSRLLNNSFEMDKRVEWTINLCRNRQNASRLLDSFRVGDQLSPQHEPIIKAAVATVRGTPWNNLEADFSKLLEQQGSIAPQQRLAVADLLRQAGDVAEGRKTFRQPESTCVGCHRAEAVGIDFGPSLSEIGTKLGRDALFEAILFPSRGISFDYEGWTLTLNSGEELTGILVSQTETTLSIKNLLGQIQPIARKDVFLKEKMTTSLMPPGLGELLGEKKLVDLVAYLSSLKQPTP